MAKFFIKTCIPDQTWLKKFQSLIQFLEIQLKHITSGIESASSGVVD